MNILGISCYYHDSAACLVRDGAVVAAAQEERFSRVKHDQEFPVRAIRFCLERGGLAVRDLDAVAFYDKPLLKFERILETALAMAPRGLRPFLEAGPLWLQHRLWIPDLIRRELGYEGRLYYPEHHQSHAAAAFFPSPFEEAAFLTLDGVGEWTTTSFGSGQGSKLSFDQEIRFPHSLGLLYSAFTYFTGFRVNSGEYKLMGLAPYGEPRYAQCIRDHLVDVKDDGSFRLNLEYFGYTTGLTMTNERFARLFDGPPRRRESPITQREMDLARSIQEVTEDILLKTARHVHRRTGRKFLCLAGGVALNCVGNGRLLREGPFVDLWIQPAAGDAGGALGAALYVWHQVCGNERRPEGDAMQGSYLGPEYAHELIREFLVSGGIPHRELAPEQTPLQAAAQIAAGRVVGWFQGRMEFGPRALGNRSILGDPRDPGMQKRMNLKIKYRESFRPFAPSVLEDRAAGYFDIDRPSPYMLLVAPVLEERRTAPAPDGAQGLARRDAVRSVVPAVTHVDYSARLHTVRRERNARFHDLIREFDRLTGCPMVINTSFNVRSEPVVCSPQDAYRCFMRTGMDDLFLGDFWLEKSRQPAAAQPEDWINQFELD